MNFRRLVSLTALGLALAGAAAGHDLFLILADHDVEASTKIEISLFNGTFDKSENAISRDRMLGVRLVDGAGASSPVAADQWRDEGPVAIVSLNSGTPGTAIFGVSTRPRLIEMSAEEFNDYLRHDGVLDTLEARRTAGKLNEPARESYAKHVKTALRVGGKTGDSWKTVFGYPVEFVPRADPFSLRAGDTLEVQLLADGEPLPGVRVYASHASHHGHGADGTHEEAVSTRTDERGVFEVPVSMAGRWYLRAIHMVEDGSGEFDYISQWATFTFEVN